MTITPQQEERLAAWLDGALPLAESQAFEAEMAGNPALQVLADQWRANDRMIAEAFAPIAQAPIDAALLNRMGLSDRTETGPAAANDNVTSPWRRMMPWGGALAAACVALVVVLTRPGAAADPLSLALDGTASLASVNLPDGRRIQPTLTVRAGDGRWCREFRDGDAIALACRNKNGRWTTEGMGRSAAPEPVGQDGIALAGGADGSALDPAYRRLRTSDPVDAKAEAQLIAHGWQ